MSSANRTTLSAPARELHDPRNLPYAAIRRAWWNGVWCCLVWVIVVAGMSAAVWLVVIDRDSKGGSAPRRPADAIDPTKHPPGAALPDGSAEELEAPQARDRVSAPSDILRNDSGIPLALPENSSIR